MKAENWTKVKEVLNESLTLPPAKREDFLKQSKVAFEVKREVESLLTHETEAKNFMSVTASGYSKDFFGADGEQPANSLVGQRVGIYEIVSELGQGGMGAVYLAERSDGKFKQKVAVKMLKREFNTEKIRRNFEREKEILATLAHPNIARLLDAGSCEDGVPYLVMEYVEGAPIDEFCRANRLVLNERLKLFNRVCEAVAFAHRNLIVHRDLKPSNILVTKAGEPKLLDFGISKLLDAESNDEPTITNLGAMTPQYASPEQIRGEVVTTATDIYSLGVVLFKILTQSFPYNFKNKTNGNLLREITDSEPIPASAATKSQPPAAADDYDISARQLEGDLDNIILKSLSKEPERRYQTVEQFSADLWRFMDGLPVSARPATFSYQARKFYGRNRVAVLAGVLILISLVTGIAVAVSQARTANAQARIAAEAQRDAEIETVRAKTEEENAKAQTEKAEKISRFMSKIISYANPGWYAEGAKFGGKARVIDAIEDLSEKIDTEFAVEADVAAELHHKFSEVFLWAGRGENAERLKKFTDRRAFHAIRALELRKQFYGERHELVAKDLFYAYYFLGKNDRERAALLAQAIEMMRETNQQNLNFPYMLEAYTANLILPGKYEKYNEPYRNAVVPQTDENKYRIAERYLREALPVFRLHYKEDNLAIWENECKLAYALAMQDKWTDFDEHYAVCKQGGEKASALKSEEESMRWFVELVEKTLAEKGK